MQTTYGRKALYWVLAVSLGLANLGCLSAGGVGRTRLANRPESVATGETAVEEKPAKSCKL